MLGGAYRPDGEIVPVEADPPATPSTNHMTLPMLAVNCWVRVKVRAATFGLIVSVGAPVVKFHTAEYELVPPELEALTCQ